MTSSTPASPTQSAWPPARTKTGNAFLGVLSGLARSIGTTPLTLRVIFLIGMFLAPDGCGIAAYFALALLMPVAVTSPDQIVRLRRRTLFSGWTIALLLVAAFVVGGFLLVLLPVGHCDALAGNCVPARGFSLANLSRIPLLGSIEQFAFGIFIIAVGAFLLFGRRSVTSADIAPGTGSLTTSAYGNASQTPRTVPLVHRSAASVSTRIGFAVAVILLPFDSLQNFCIFPAAAGLVIAAAFAIRDRHDRLVLVPIAAVFATVAVLAGSTGGQIDTLWSEYSDAGNIASPYYARHHMQYRYVGSVRKYNPIDPGNVYGNIDEAFVAGETIVHVQAPNDNRVVFDGRMTAGEIIVRNVDNEGRVVTKVSSQSGLWTTKQQTYGTGPKELRVAVHGGVGSIVLEIDRSEYVGPICNPTAGSPGSYECK